MALLRKTPRARHFRLFLVARPIQGKGNRRIANRLHSLGERFEYYPTV